MKITGEQVEHVAELARLEVTPEEKEDLTRQMNRILSYMEKLNELDTTEVAPTSHVIDLYNAFREDVVQESLSREDCLANAPESSDSDFVVPKVL